MLPKDIERFSDTVGPACWLAVSGQSCSGKSSLLRLYLQWALRRSLEMAYAAEPMDDYNEELWSRVRCPILVLDGLTRHRDDGFVRRLPAERAGAFAF